MILLRAVGPTLVALGIAFTVFLAGAAAGGFASAMSHCLAQGYGDYKLTPQDGFRRIDCLMPLEVARRP